ncbi:MULTISPECIES: transcriptional regulator FtsR [Cellulomonas]|uniref:transcriptional regulator FtsR n=1 Tax=Cellulomonas TaxID=1707 RepID=UPI002795DB0E|nr:MULTISPECIES: MerR family transcriptional regulator [Cellulomonas]
MTPPDGAAARAVRARAASEDVRAAEDGTAPEPWPRGISRRASMRISDVLAALRLEFPAVTTSKLRFLEEQGLVAPVRTPSGYRQYSPADVERLRFVLRQQRDRYMPLKVIGERLAALDAGAEDEDAAPPRARLATSDGVARTPGRMTAERLAQDAGVAPGLVEELVALGVLRPDHRGAFDAWARDVVVAAAALGEHGIDPRHLRAFRAAADRQADLVEQVVAPWRGQRSVSARARAGTLAAEVGELCGQMHTALLRSSVADLAP